MKLKELIEEKILPKASDKEDKKFKRLLKFAGKKERETLLKRINTVRKSEGKNPFDLKELELEVKVSRKKADLKRAKKQGLTKDKGSEYSYSNQAWKNLEKKVIDHSSEGNPAKEERFHRIKVGDIVKFVYYHGYATGEVVRKSGLKAFIKHKFEGKEVTTPRDYLKILEVLPKGPRKKVVLDSQDKVMDYVGAKKPKSKETKPLPKIGDEITYKKVGGNKHNGIVNQIINKHTVTVKDNYSYITRKDILNIKSKKSEASKERASDYGKIVSFKTQNKLRYGKILSQTEKSARLRYLDANDEIIEKHVPLTRIMEIINDTRKVPKKLLNYNVKKDTKRKATLEKMKYERY
jgi:hypothetical protein